MISLAKPTNQSKGYVYALAIALVVVLASFVFESVFLGENSALQSWLGHLISAQFSLLFLLMLAVWHFGPKSQNLGDYRAILIVGIIARVVLFPIDPYLSNDVERYLFDGYIASVGLDPYTVSHESPLLGEVISEWTPPSEHLKYVTLYPPLALALFTFAASFGATLAPFVWKLLVISAAVGTFVLGVNILKRLQKLQHLALIALSPILILETGIGVHVDAFSTLFIALAIHALLPSQPQNEESELPIRNLVIAGIFIGLGTLSKLLPIVLLAPLTMHFMRSSFKHAFSLVSATLVTLILGYLLSFALGLTPIGSIGVFFEKFRFGSPFFYWLEQNMSLERAALITSVILITSFIVLSILTWSKHWKLFENNSVVTWQVALCLPLFFSPVVYSWYLAPLALLVAIRPNLPLLVWLGLMPLTYEVLGKWICCNDWSPATWPLSLIASGLSISIAYLFFKKPTKPLERPTDALINRVHTQ